jgi:hypothetical protein
MLQQFESITLDEYFSKPVIPLHNEGRVRVDQYPTATVEHHYNSAGYRTIEFDQVQSPYVLATGCSLTEGMALHLEQTWAVKLAHALNKPLVNLAKGGANADFVSQNILNWCTSDMPLPSLVVIQWPNPFRSTHWSHGRARFVLSQTADAIYQAKAVESDENFWADWIRSIVFVDQLLTLLGIPHVHISLETAEFMQPALASLAQHRIQLHLDLKQPGQTWHFDSAAPDGCHHSEFCHTKWAERILTLVNNQL